MFYFRTYDLPFRPITYEIECKVKEDYNIDSNGPSEAQRAFFKHIESNYELLVGQLILLLKDELNDWEPPFDFENFGAAFRLAYLLVPELDSKPILWDWSFEINQNNMYTLSISAQDNSPQSGIGVSN